MPQSDRKSIGVTLPFEQYTSEELFEREIECLFDSEWVCIGRSDDVSEPGDTIALSVLGRSILLMRNEHGVLGAFHNVCRHRGCELSDTIDWHDAPVATNVGINLRCRYHSWMYKLDGSFARAPHMDPDVSDASRSLALNRIHLSEWGGFMFINLNAGSSPKTLDEHLAKMPGYFGIGDITSYFERYGLPDLRRGGRIVYDVHANWKIIIENYQECYHCGGVHPELCEVVPAFKSGGFDLDYAEGVPHRDGAYTYTFSGTTKRQPFPALNDEERVRHKAYLVMPNLMLSASCDHIAAFTLIPLSVDRTVVVTDFLFHADEVSRSDFDPSDCIDFWDVTDRQDWSVCEAVQRGMTSAGSGQGIYGPMEGDAQSVAQYVRDCLE